MKLFQINSIGSALRALLGWPLLLIGLYALAALICSNISVNSDWREDSGGIPVYLYDNGIHLSIIMPAEHVDADGLGIFYYFPKEHILDQSIDTQYLMFGWGEREFYLNTPTWWDIKPKTIISALAGSGETLLHVDHLDHLPQGVKRIRLTKEEYHNISLAMVQTVAGEDLSTKPQPIKGYGRRDVFYTALGPDYNAFYTCNVWIGDLLKNAGLKNGIWTPLPGGVLHWFNQPAQQSEPRPPHQ